MLGLFAWNWLNVWVSCNNFIKWFYNNRTGNTYPLLHSITITHDMFLGMGGLKESYLFAYNKQRFMGWHFVCQLCFVLHWLLPQTVIDRVERALTKRGTLYWWDATLRLNVLWRNMSTGEMPPDEDLVCNGQFHIQKTNITNYSPFLLRATNTIIYWIKLKKNSWAYNIIFPICPHTPQRLGHHLS